MIVFDLPYTDLVFDPVVAIIAIGVEMFIVWLRQALKDQMIPDPVSNRLDEIKEMINHVEDTADKILKKLK